MPGPATEANALPGQRGRRQARTKANRTCWAEWEHAMSDTAGLNGPLTGGQCWKTRWLQELNLIKKEE